MLSRAEVTESFYVDDPGWSPGRTRRTTRPATTSLHRGSSYVIGVDPNQHQARWSSTLSFNTDNITLSG